MMTLMNLGYLRLMRVDKPVGFWLLLWPTLWALWVASAGRVSLKLFIIFTLGVFIMRSAGCVINDIWDRNFDGHVERTANRPLAKKEVTLKGAIILLCFLLCIALVLVCFLNFLCFELACVSLFITLIYPLMKRWIVAPQCVLGIAFSLGIPMAFAAVQGDLSHFSWLLWLLGILWPVIYDTLYAMVDRKDDLKLGLHSTAIWFGQWDKSVIAMLEVIWLVLWGIFAYQNHLSFIFYLGLAGVGILLFYEYMLIRNREPKVCFKAFLNHAWIGSILWISLALAYKIN